MIMQKTFITILFTLFFLSNNACAQINENKTGAWYMYFWNTTFKDSRFGLQGDAQYRNWNIIGDLEQLLIRGGVTYSPHNANIKFTLGYANLSTGTYGESNFTFTENRIYQEALLAHKLTNHLYLTHRFRYEQRWVADQDLRTRYRYNLFLNVPLNQSNLNENSIYLAFYNELFINGEQHLGDGRRLDLFDRNRFYTGIGYGVSNTLRLQLGYLDQTTFNFIKGQLQLSLHHTL